ncbi:class I SAM-dependent methyltransferase [Bacillus testis]|uniref:class I SAM-dependent methyltransferase n=1 Tax=Bacillus testis TaxID=1622072 RepID=UPI00067F4CFB|nr:class I SAM-dependent methyltransferase [Bacillus testis]
MDNFEEYEDPYLYDQENSSLTADISFLSKMAEKCSGPIIDLACGTGRATVPLAKLGHHIIGIDIHTGMLEAAKKKTSSLNLPIEWMEQDCTRLNMDIKTDFIYSVGNSFQHFLTNEEQDGLLVSVHKLLKKDGLFIFNTRFPSTEELLQPPTEEYWRSYTDSKSHLIVDVFTISRYDSLSQTQHYTTIRKYKGINQKTIAEKRTTITLRYVFPKEMERLLPAHGLKIVEIYKDWQGTLLDNDSYEMVYVCQKI